MTPTDARTPLDVETQRVLDERARQLAAAPDDRHASTEPHLVIRVGEQRLGLPAGRARHVSPPRPLTSVPAVPEAIVGATAVLGDLVAVAELGALIGASADRLAEQSLLVVIDDGAEALGLLVDEVEGLVDIDVDLVTTGDPALGHLAGRFAEDLRLLDIDTLLADPRLSNTGSPSGAALQGEL